MATRYDNVKRIINNSDFYSNLLESKNRNFIEQYSTYALRPVTQEIFVNLQKIEHVWSSGDKYFSLSAKYYENSRYWWVIAWFNNKPTEHSLSIGDIIYIPLPVTRALSYYYGG